jgi:hypothetical protein
MKISMWYACAITLLWISANQRKIERIGLHEFNQIPTHINGLRQQAKTNSLLVSIGSIVTSTELI